MELSIANPKSEGYKFRVSEFRLIFVVFILLLAACGTVLIGSLINPGLNDALEASRGTPWGIVTSLFAHATIEDFIGNMLALFIFFIIFAICNSFLSYDEKNKRMIFLIVVSFIMAIVANLVWVLLAPNGAATLGASGIVYSAEGITVGFALFNGLLIIDWRRFNTKEIYSKVLIASNLIIAIVFVVQGVFFTSLFLGVEPGVNAAVHGLAFLFSLFVTVIWMSIRKRIIE
jgi:membrane associated rhomboid family serine protease